MLHASGCLEGFSHIHYISTRIAGETDVLNPTQVPSVVQIDLFDVNVDIGKIYSELYVAHDAFVNCCSDFPDIPGTCNLPKVLTNYWFPCPIVCQKIVFVIGHYSRYLVVTPSTIQPGLDQKIFVSVYDVGGYTIPVTLSVELENGVQLYEAPIISVSEGN